jgi:hypothetical protein
LCRFLGRPFSFLLSSFSSSSGGLLACLYL